MKTDGQLVLHLYFSDLAGRGCRVLADAGSGRLYRVNGSWASLAQDSASEIERGRAFWGRDFSYVGTVAHDRVAVLVDGNGTIDADAARRLGLRPVLSEIEAHVASGKVVPLFPRR